MNKGKIISFFIGVINCDLIFLTYIIPSLIIFPDDFLCIGLLQIVDDVRDDTTSSLDHHAYRCIAPFSGNIQLDPVQVAGQSRSEATSDIVLEHTLQNANAIFFFWIALPRRLAMDVQSEPKNQENRRDCLHGYFPKIDFHRSRRTVIHHENRAVTSLTIGRHLFVLSDLDRQSWPWTACHGLEVVVERTWSNIYETRVPSIPTSASSGFGFTRV